MGTHASTEKFDVIVEIINITNYASLSVSRRNVVIRRESKFAVFLQAAMGPTLLPCATALACIVFMLLNISLVSSEISYFPRKFYFLTQVSLITVSL